MILIFVSAIILDKNIIINAMSFGKHKLLFQYVNVYEKEFMIFFILLDMFLLNSV